MVLIFLKQLSKKSTSLRFRAWVTYKFLLGRCLESKSSEIFGGGGFSASHYHPDGQTSQ